jgi:DNA-directed RNA polymerase specialized sigma24 family protein
MAFLPKSKHLDRKEPLQDDHQTDWNSLLQKAKNGGDVAQNALCRALEVRLHPILQSRLWGWPKEDHEDILQNTLIVVIEKINQIDSNPHYFALNVLRNKIGDALRGRQGHRETGLDLGYNDDSSGQESRAEHSMAFADPEQDIAGQAELGDFTQRIRNALRQLSKFCQAFFLAMLEDRSVGEVWELFSSREPKLTRSAFDKRVFDCRKRMRQLMQGAMVS